MPNTNTPSISSDVPIGRRIKGSEMLIVASSYRAVSAEPSSSTRRSGRCLDLDAGAIDQPVLPFDDDPLARRQPFLDDGNAVLRGGDADLAPLDRAVLGNYVGKLALRPVHDGLCGHGRYVAARVEHHPHVDKLAGP